MTTVERRSTVVQLHQGGYAQQLKDLLDETMAAQRAEDSGGPRRVGERSKAMDLAKKYDKLLAEAESSAISVTLWEISYRHWGFLSDAHPPREGDKTDEVRGVSMKTFPHALLCASLVSGEKSELVTDTNKLVELGQATLDGFGDISRLHYAKLERSAWAINVEDDALPKHSLVSLLTQASEPDSAPPNDSE